MDSIDLAYADFRNSTFTFTVFQGENNKKLNLRNITFKDTKFAKPNISGGRSVKFVNVDLYLANFKGATISGADFINADLHNANFTNVKFDDSTFDENTNLSGATWIDGIQKCRNGSFGRCIL